MINFDHICRDNDIHYSLHAGTLLGCIREQGFIPWDDDIDIWVPIAEYERFLAIAKKETPYRILDNLHDVGWSRSFSKVSDRRTVVINDEAKSRTLKKYGVSVDIFPLFGIPDDPAWCEKLLKTRRKVVYLQRYRMGLYKGLHPKNVSKKLWAGSNLLLGRDEQFFKSQILEQELSNPDSPHVGCIISVYKTKDIHDRKWFSDTVKLSFEGVEFDAPVGYDAVLRKIYGDYMQLPPPEMQKAHDLEHAFWVTSKDTDQ